MNATHVVYIVYAGKIYKASIIDRGYFVGELNMILPFPQNRVLSMAA